MPRIQLSVVLDEDLAHRLDDHVAASGLEKSTIVRDLLRRALAMTPDERTLGWYEGKLEALREGKRILEEGIRQIGQRKRDE